MLKNIDYIVYITAILPPNFERARTIQSFFIVLHNHYFKWALIENLFIVHEQRKTKLT